MLFDLNDYVVEGIIGTSQQPMNSTKWTYCYGIYQATRDALSKAVLYYATETINCDSSCQGKVNELIEEFNINISNLIEKGDIFWNGLIDSTNTQKKYEDYSQALEAYMYSIRKFFSILDDDKLTFK